MPSTEQNSCNVSSSFNEGTALQSRSNDSWTNRLRDVSRAMASPKAIGSFSRGKVATSHHGFIQKSISGWRLECCCCCCFRTTCCFWIRTIHVAIRSKISLVETAWRLKSNSGCSSPAGMCPVHSKSWPPNSQSSSRHSCEQYTCPHSCRQGRRRYSSCSWSSCCDDSVVVATVAKQAGSADTSRDCCGEPQWAKQ